MLSKMQINKTLKIGITGGIGSGKSVISRILKTMGYPIYDSDSWAKKLMNESEEIRNSLILKFKNSSNKKQLQFFATVFLLHQ